MWGVRSGDAVRTCGELGQGTQLGHVGGTQLGHVGGTQLGHVGN